MAVPSPVTISSDESDNERDSNSRIKAHIDKLIEHYTELTKIRPRNEVRACLPKFPRDDTAYEQSSDNDENDSVHSVSSARGYTNSEYLDEVVEVSSSVGSDIGGIKSIDPPSLESEENLSKKEESKKEESTKQESKKEESTKQESKKEELKKEECQKQESKKEESKKEETKKEESKKQESKKEESKKEETKKQESQNEESKKEESMKQEQESNKEEFKQQESKKEESKKQESKKEESKKVAIKRKSVDGPEDKGKKKANAALEKDAKKQKLAEEKATRKTANEMNKIYKSGECMKYMNIEGHPTLWSRWYMSDVGREAGAAGARVVQVSSLCHPALVVWTRSLPRALDGNSAQVRLTPSQERCDRALYIASADELCELVSSHTLATHLAQIQELCGCNLTLVVFRVDDYFKSPTRRKTSNSNRTPMTEIDLELALTDLLVSAECDTVTVNTPNELALLIVQFTKAIAKAPLKKAQRDCDEIANFFMRGDNKKCVSVDRDGTGKGRLWQQMIAVLPQSSLETSRAICSRYKSPLELYQSLQFTNSVEELADIGVSRAAVPGSKARRVGPEFARKLNTLFTAQQGDTLVE